MTKDALNERKQALEDEFFYRVDEQLIANIKSKAATESQRRQLEASTGISDVQLLDELAAAGASAESIAAISLVPLILVAWADGKVEAEERETILKFAAEQGIASDSPPAKLLEHWLLVKPKRELSSTWKHYITEVTLKMSDESRAVLRKDLIERACAVANASGGVLGFGKTSKAEKNVINELEQALSPTSVNQ